MAGRNLSGVIYDQLATRINTWIYPPGHRLIEDAISAEFGVSRSPVREALNMLVEAALVEKEECKGYLVRRMDMRNINELYDTRLVLELAIIDLICKNGMDETILGSLEKRWRELLNALPDMAREAALEDEQFHETIAEAGGNQVIKQLLSDIDRRIHFVRISDITDPDRLKTTCIDHLEILDALGKKDHTLAAAAIKRNIQWGRQQVSAALRDALARVYGV